MTTEDNPDKPVADANQDLDDIFDDIKLADLDNLFQSLPTPDISAAAAEREAVRKAAAEIAKWLPKRRVLYISRRRCQTCGATHDMPNERLLTEFQHSKDGTRKWAKADPLSAHLPVEHEYLEGHPCQVCHFCTGD